MFKIGKRTIKTAVAVGLALLVKVILVLAIDIPTGQTYSKLIYTPFFGGIAAAYSMHANMNASKKQAKIRTMGSLVGGLYGMVILILAEALFIHGIHIDHDSIWYYIMDYTIVAIAIIPMIHITVVTKKTYATWIACLTYLSVTVSIRNDFDDQLAGLFSDNAAWNSYIIAIIFALNRILSTIIGVSISLGVNVFQWKHRTKNKDVLFCIGIEGVVIGDKDRIAGYMNYQINHMVESGANCTLFTTRVPRTFMHFFGNVNVNHPIVCMSGAALYDAKNLTYIDKEEIPYEISKKLDEILDAHQITPFKNYIIDDVLNVYCEHIGNPGEEAMAKRMKNEGYGNFFMGKCPVECNPLFYMMIDTKQAAEQMMKEFEEKNLAEYLTVQVYDVFDEDSQKNPDLVYIKIYSKEILKLRVLKDYCTRNNLRIAGLTTSTLSNHLLDNSEIKVTSTNREDAIVIKDYEDMVKQISYIYYNKQFCKESQVKS